MFYRQSQNSKVTDLIKLFYSFINSISYNFASTCIMKNILILVLALFVATAQAQNYQLSGFIEDQESGETLIGATIFNETNQAVSISNEYGFYSIQVEAGLNSIRFAYVGYQTKTVELTISESQEYKAQLEPDDFSVESVVITYDEDDRAIETAQMSVNTISANEIKTIPTVLGEVDVLQSLQLLPGVANNGEGSNGFSVRGGAQDQNLVLLDEAIIFNTAHVLGFFSVFNNDAIKDVKLYKGGIPAQYGGRASSVLDVRQKDGNDQNFQLQGGLGLISSRLLAEGPIGNKRKFSYLMAGRTSYVNLFLKLADNPNSLSFYDLNTKLNWDINDKNKLYLSGYFGNDTFRLSDFFENKYGNGSANLRWNHVFNNKLFSNLSAIYSDYRYNLEFDAIKFRWNSGIENTNIKYDFDWFPNQNMDVKFGINSIFYNFNPGEIVPTGTDSGINYRKLQEKNSIESGVYAQVNHDIGDRFSMQYGLRFSAFYRMGKQSINQYANDLPVVYNKELGIYESAEPIGSVEYSNGDIIRSFHEFEPRIAMAYKIADQATVKASYNRLPQYIHLISNNISPTPFDVWAPSGSFFEPQIANQIAVGYAQRFRDQQYLLEVESYYKTVSNRLDYIDGSDLVGNEDIEQEVLVGENRAYGAEFLLRKSKGQATGWLAYTLARTQQRTPGGDAGGLGINDGEWYFANYDRTHDFALTANYELSKKWSFSGNFVLQSGRPVTYPNGQYTYQNLNVANFTARNSERLPMYHRLDLAATLTPKKNEKRKFDNEWVFGVYNAYDRRNANSISFSQNQDTGLNEATKISVYGIVPAVTWNFKFN